MAPQNNNGSFMGGFNPMFMPPPPQALSDAGNSMLNSVGIPSYQPRLNMFTSNQFAMRHPGIAGALQGALANLASTPSAAPVQGFGAGLQQAAQGVMGGLGMQREFQWGQAMAPMMIASQMANFQRQFAPEAINTKYGIVQRSPISGQLKPGLGLAEIAAGNNGASLGNAVYDRVHARADTETDPALKQMWLDGAEYIKNIPDPIDQQKAALQLQSTIETRRLQETNQSFMRGIAARNATSNEKRAGAIQQMANVRSAEYNLHAQRFAIDMGIDPKTHKWLTPDQMPPGSITAGPYGIGKQFAKNVSPNETMRNMGQYAATIEGHLPRIYELINQLDQDGMMGPVQGRFNDFLTGKVGVGDPRYAELRDEFNYLTTAAMLTHVGKSGSQDMMNHFSKMFDEGFSPNILKASMDVTHQWISNYEQAGSMKTNIGGYAGNVKTSNAPNPNPMVPPGSGQPQATHVWTPNGLQQVTR